MTRYSYTTIAIYIYITERETEREINTLTAFVRIVNRGGGHKIKVIPVANRSRLDDDNTRAEYRERPPPRSDVLLGPAGFMTNTHTHTPALTSARLLRPYNNMIKTRAGTSLGLASCTYVTRIFAVGGRYTRSDQRTPFPAAVSASIFVFSTNVRSIDSEKKKNANIPRTGRIISVRENRRRGAFSTG